MSEAATLFECLKTAANSGLGVRFVDRRGGSSEYTYSEIAELARGVARGLFDIGVRQGDRVGVCFPNEVGFYAAFFGSLCAGAVPCPLPSPTGLNRSQHYEGLQARLDSVGARVMLAPPRVAARVPSREDLSCVSLCSLDTSGDGDPDLGPGASPDALALIQFSSGTTGRPKGVALSHRQLLQNVRTILDTLLDAYPENEIRHSAVSWLPLYHDMGLVGALMTALVLPGPLTLMAPERFAAKPASWLWRLHEDRASISPAPNFAYQYCLDRVNDTELRGLDLSHWKIALCGAEPVSAQTMDRFADTMAPSGFERSALTPVYGMAEAGLAVTFSDIARDPRWLCVDRQALCVDGRVREVVPDGTDGNESLTNGESSIELVSVGRPLSGVGLRVVGRRGTDLPAGWLGTIWIRGPSVIASYYRNRADASVKAAEPSEDEDSLFDGAWFNTGDLGFLHHGELYLWGRSKEILIVRGRNYSPWEIETCFSDFASEGVVVAVSTAMGDVDAQELSLFVEARLSTKRRSELDRLLRARLSQRLGLGVSQVHFLDGKNLPRTSSGKLKRGEIRAMTASNHSPNPHDG